MSTSSQPSITPPRLRLSGPHGRRWLLMVLAPLAILLAVSIITFALM